MRVGRCGELKVCWGPTPHTFPYIFPITLPTSFPHTPTHFPTTPYTFPHPSFLPPHPNTFSYYPHISLHLLKVWRSYHVSKFLWRSYHVAKLLATVLIIVIVAKTHCSMGLVIYAFTLTLHSICFLLIIRASFCNFCNFFLQLREAFPVTKIFITASMEVFVKILFCNFLQLFWFLEATIFCNFNEIFLKSLAKRYEQSCLIIVLIIS